MRLGCACEKITSPAGTQNLQSLILGAFELCLKIQGQARQMLQSMHQQQQHQASWNALQQNQQANSAASPNAGTAGQAHQGGQAVVQERAMHAHTGSYSGVDLAGQKRKAEMEQVHLLS